MPSHASSLGGADFSKMGPKHTPGPWWVVADDPRDRNFAALVATSTATYSIDCTRSGADRHEDMANAHLIAAAPDLLAALEDLRLACADAYKAGRIDAEAFVRAGNVLARARGEGA